MIPISKRRLIAEGEKQDGVLLAWPHAGTDWAGQLQVAQQTFAEIIRAITRFETVVLIVPSIEATLPQLAAYNIDLNSISCYELPCNDTWARDFGPLAIETEQGIELQNFIFNGWGNKFCANLDNRLTQGLSSLGAFGHTDLNTVDLVLEGGSIESDGNGTLMTTENCLLEKNRNPQLSRQEIAGRLKEVLGVQRVLWLKVEALKGDDTDSHIDTLARFATADTIVFQGCDDPEDPNFSTLAKLREQLSRLRCNNGGPYRLLELPWPQACYDAQHNRLPATYANFLIINQAVLVPTYADPADSAALISVGKAFPDRAIIPIDCRALIEQHGSLHCITMQLPKGVLP
ncbi:MAG: agmatine deiminase family protein [Geopsychrobacter sp.]|nr:agmatine deiminase family protein [Geopsychrobacter sp.]